MAALVVWKAGASSLRLSRQVGLGLQCIVHWQPIDRSRAGWLLLPLKLPQRKSIAVSYRFCWVAEVWSKGKPYLSASCFGKDFTKLRESDTVNPQIFHLRINLSQMSFYRGSSRGFGTRCSSWRGKDRRSQAKSPVPSALTLPLGQVVDSISIKALLVEQDAPTIQDVEYVASYNWLEGKSPIILVPGKRPEWNHIDHSLSSTRG